MLSLIQGMGLLSMIQFVSSQCSNFRHECKISAHPAGLAAANPASSAFIPQAFCPLQHCGFIHAALKNGWLMSFVRNTFDNCILLAEQNDLFLQYLYVSRHVMIFAPQKHSAIYIFNVKGTPRRAQGTWSINVNTSNWILYHQFNQCTDVTIFAMVIKNTVFARLQLICITLFIKTGHWAQIPAKSFSHIKLYFVWLGPWRVQG